MDQVPLLIIDPNQLFREGLHTILSRTEFDVIHGTADIGEGLEFIKTNDGIKMVILDFSDDGSDGELEILKQMRAANEDAKLIVLTNKMSAPLLTRALSAGADAYLLKSLSSEPLLQSLRLVVLGEKVFPTQLAPVIASEQLGPAMLEARTSSAKVLSEREREILRCLVQGGSNKVIGSKLGIAESTVKVHLKAVLRKLNLSNRTQAAIWAMGHGLGRVEIDRPDRTETSEERAETG